MIKTVYKEWHNEHMGVTRKMDMPVDVQRLDRTQLNHEGFELTGFWMANWYATGPEYYQCYLREAALQDLELAQLDCVEAGGSILIVDTWRSWEQQMKAYKNKPKLAVHPDKSNHPKGLAIDARAHGISQEQMAEFLADYEWHATVPHEPWHYDYEGSLEEG